MVKPDESGRGDVSLCKDKEADYDKLKISPVGVDDKPTKKDMAPQRKVKIPCSFLSVIFSFVVVFGCAVQGANGQGFTLVKTKQAMPGGFWATLKGNGCPQRGEFDHWQEHNQICCANYPGLFHCQEPKIPGGTLIFAACLPEQTVPPGKIGRFIKNETGFPELDLTTDCDHGTYRSESINSSFIRYPRCEEKTRQNSDEEKNMARGEDRELEKGQKGSVNDRPQDKEADSLVLNISLMGLNKPTRKILCSRRMTFLLSVLIFFSAVQCANGFIMEKTKQALPEECLSWLKKNGCPQRGVFNHWQKCNKICCADYPGLFHCQEPKIDGWTLIFAACLPEQTVPPGKIGRLVKNETDFLELDLTTDCDHGTYRSESINSSFIRYPRCKEKTKQNSDEEKVCDGGITAYDLFVCKEGYQSNCSQGRNSSHDLCECSKLNCAEGSQPFQNMTGSCSAGNFRVTYGCQFGSGEKGTEIPPGPTTTTTTTTKQGGNIVLMILCVLVAVIFGM